VNNNRKGKDKDIAELNHYFPFSHFAALLEEIR